MTDLHEELLEVAANALFVTNNSPGDTAHAVLAAVLPRLADRLRLDCPSEEVVADNWRDAATYIEGLSVGRGPRTPRQADPHA